MTRVAILGCGYVGLALGRRLVENDHHVIGVKRSGLDAVESAGLHAVHADVTDSEALAELPDVDWVVFTASADGREPAAYRRTYVDGVETVLDHFGSRPTPPSRFVYTSSTGVYGDRGGDWVDETTSLDPSSDRSRALVDAEIAVREMASANGIDWTITRFTGLYGPGRFQVERYLDGDFSDRYVNLVHRDDAAGAVAFILESENALNEVVLVTDDEPVTRNEIARWLATRLDRSPPVIRATDAPSGKRCSNDRLRSLGYEFVFPTFRDGLSDVVSTIEYP